MALAETGQWRDAVARQQEAIELFQAANRTPNPRLTEMLRQFERHEPARVPWTTDPT